MDTKRRQKKKPKPQAATPTPKGSFLKREWPLLLFPALVLAALAMLYLTNQSLQERLARTTNTQPEATHADDGTGDASPDDAQISPIPAGSGDTADATTPAQPPTATSDRADRIDAIRTMRSRNADARRLDPDSLMGAATSQEREPVAVLLGALRHAVDTKDHARIKQIMRDLVAMGDDAVMPLAELVSSGRDETALWAADALARIGTPAATTALLDTLELVKDGFYKEQLAKRASNISNHDSWPTLLDALQDSKDPTVQRAAASSLSGMADTPVVDEIVARYDTAATPEEAARLAQVVSNIDSPGASESLRSLAGDVASVPQDPLQQAALDALAKIGDPQSVSYLLQKLEASAPGENSYVYNTVTTIEQPQAHAALLYAAAGNKEVSAEQGRTAAIYALGNYPSEETYRLLQQIVAAEDNTAVATAALRTLENIEKREPAIAEKTTSKADTTSLLISHPLQK